MKKTNPNKLNRHSVILVVALLVAMFIATAVGCNKPPEEEDSPDTSAVVSEVSSTSEVSESISEESSSEVVVSEEPAEATEIDLSQYTQENGKKVVDLANDMNYDEFKIIVWRHGVGAIAILSNGDSYQLQDDDDSLFLYFPEEMSDFKFNEYSVYMPAAGGYRTRAIDVIGFGENKEVTIAGTDVNGKEYEITVYITKEE